eukprot:m51a1_g7988 hypothetical protein (389) ;mRNA; f:84885-95619
MSLWPSKESGWYAHCLKAIEMLLSPHDTPEAKKLQATRDHTDHLADLFKATMTATHETHVKQLSMLERGLLRHLSVPGLTLAPSLTLEPLAKYYLCPGAPGGPRLVGIGCCGLCVAAWSPAALRTWRLCGVDGDGSDDAVARVVLNAAAWGAGVDEVPVRGLAALPRAGGDLARGVRVGGALLREAVGRVAGRGGELCVSVSAEGDVGGALPGRHVYTGSFNPFHEGHRSLLLALEEHVGVQPVIEISATNVDKPPLSTDEALRRVAQFAGRWDVLVTAAPLFVHKARLLPRSVFVVGYDTAARVLDPKYYGGSADAAAAALAEIRERGCSFLVAGRLKDGVFRTFAAARSQLPLPQFHSMFADIPESVFRCDISSTQLRKEGRPGVR